MKIIFQLSSNPHLICSSVQDEADLANGNISVDHDVEMSERVLRTAQLEELLTHGDKSQSTTEGILNISQEMK